MFSIVACDALAVVTRSAPHDVAGTAAAAAAAAALLSAGIAATSKVQRGKAQAAGRGAASGVCAAERQKAWLGEPRWRPSRRSAGSAARQAASRLDSGRCSRRLRVWSAWAFTRRQPLEREASAAAGVPGTRCCRDVRLSIAEDTGPPLGSCTSVGFGAASLAARGA